MKFEINKKITPLGPGFYITSVEDGMEKREGSGLFLGFHGERHLSQYSESQCSVPTFKRRSISL